MLSLLRPPAAGRSRSCATGVTVSYREDTRVRHTMATSQYSCEEWWFGDSTYCVACTCSLLGVCCGHFESPMLHPFTLPIVRRQGGFHCSHTLAFAHRHPSAIGTSSIVSKSSGCALVGKGLSLSGGSSIITVTESDCFQQQRPMAVNGYMRYPYPPVVSVSATRQSGSPSDYDFDFHCANLTLVHAAVSSTQEGYRNCSTNGVLDAPHATSS